MPSEMQQFQCHLSGPRQESRNKTYLIVSGLPASGKSTLARAIAEALLRPMLDKDVLLERLFDELGSGDPAWRTRLSRMADVELLKRADAASGAVVTSWWRHPRSASASGTPTESLASLRGDLVELHCVCSPAIAAGRFMQRTRHAGHLDGQWSHEALLASFAAQAALGPLGIGPLVEIDTEAATPDVTPLLRVLALHSGSARTASLQGPLRRS